MLSDSARIEMGGGFYSYGYLVELDVEATDSRTAVWRAYFYDNQNNLPLTTHRLTNDDAFTEEELLAHAFRTLDALIDANPDRAIYYEMKLRTLGDFGRLEEAQSLCREALEENPEDWWIVLINALLEDARGSTAEAELLITEWVARNPNFFSYLDLATFYEWTGHPDRAAAAILEATKYDADVPWGHRFNSEARGLAAAIAAYESGHFVAAHELCVHLADVEINGDFAKENLFKISIAAQAALSGDVGELVLEDPITFWPFSGLDVERLLGQQLVEPGNRSGWIQAR